MKKRIKILLLFFFIIIGLSFSSQNKSFADAGGFRGNKNFSRTFKLKPKSSLNNSIRNKNNSNNIGSSRSYFGSNTMDTFTTFMLFSMRGLAPFAIILLYIILRKILKARLNKSDIEEEREYIINNFEVNEESFKLLLQKDPDFSMQDFKKHISKIYIEMQQCWMNKDFEPMRAYMRPEIFSQINEQLTQLKKDGYTNIMKNIAVLGVEPIEYSQDSQNQIIKLILNTRLVDYTINEEDELVVGSKTDEVFMTYLYTVVRNIDAKTKVVKENSHAMTCESCGATIDIYQSARCPYCGRITEIKSDEWAINNIEAISQE